MITKETQTIIDTRHTYKIPFEEFWNYIKDSKIVRKELTYNPAYANMTYGDPDLKIILDEKNLIEYLSTLGIKGKIYLVSTNKKGDTVEILTEERVVKNGSKVSR